MAGSRRNDPLCRGKANSWHWQSNALPPYCPGFGPTRPPHRVCCHQATFAQPKVIPVVPWPIPLLRGDNEMKAAAGALPLHQAQSTVRFQTAGVGRFGHRYLDRRSTPPCGWCPGRCPPNIEPALIYSQSSFTRELRIPLASAAGYRRPLPLSVACPTPLRWHTGAPAPPHLPAGPQRVNWPE